MLDVINCLQSGDRIRHGNIRKIISYHPSLGGFLQEYLDYSLRQLLDKTVTYNFSIHIVDSYLHNFIMVTIIDKYLIL